MCYSKFLAYLISGEPHNNLVRNYSACHFVAKETEVREGTYLKKQTNKQKKEREGEVTCCPVSTDQRQRQNLYQI